MVALSQIGVAYSPPPVGDRVEQEQKEPGTLLWHLEITNIGKNLDYI